MNDEKNGDSGGKRLDSPRKTVFSYFFFLMPPFFFKGTKNKAPEKCSEAVRGTDLNEGNLYYTVIKGGNMKTHGHDRDTNQPL